MTTLIDRRVLTAIGAACLALAAAACGSSAPAASTPPPATAPAAPVVSTVMLKMAHTSLGMVLTDGAGFTVYWFAADTATTSACSGACAAAWPPLIGVPQAAFGVKLGGKLGEIMRSNGQMQATYDGHPLYLFAGDTSPGEVNGNGINGFGALWWAIKIGASTTASTTHSGNTGNSGSTGGTSGSSGGGSSGGSGGGSW
jgi:predicted lipoprotein with Yx(FWY)xxD motif